MIVRFEKYWIEGQTETVDGGKNFHTPSYNVLVLHLRIRMYKLRNSQLPITWARKKQPGKKSLDAKYHMLFYFES